MANPNIAKNTSYLTLAMILQKVISFSYFALLARVLGPADLGKYYFAIAFTTIFAIFIDLGFANVLTREVAKRQKMAGEFVGNIMSLKVLLSLLTLGAIIIISSLTQNDILTRNLIFISSFTIILDSFTNTFYSTIRAHHNLKYESLASVFYQFLILCFGGLALYFNLGLWYLMAALLVASFYNFFYSLWALQKKIGLKIHFVFSKKITKEIIMISWPFAAYAILHRLYLYSDSVMLSYMAGDYQVGLYQVAFKMIFALQFIPMAFMAALYPAMASYWGKKDLMKLKQLLAKAFNYLLIMSLPVIAVILTASDKIVLLFKEEYLAAVPALKVSIIALVFLFLNFPIGSLLNACDLQKKNTGNMLKVAIFSIFINLLLIPKFGALGAAYTALFSNALLFILGARLIKKIVPYSFKDNLWQSFKTLLATLITGLFIFLLLGIMNVWFTLLLAALVYFASILILKVLSKDDIMYVVYAFKGKK